MNKNEEKRFKFMQHELATLYGSCRRIGDHIVSDMEQRVEEALQLQSHEDNEVEVTANEIKRIFLSEKRMERDIEKIFKATHEIEIEMFNFINDILIKE